MPDIVLNNVVMQQLCKTASEWESENPILEEGRIGYVTDTNKSKYGDGSTRWLDLGYHNVTPDEIADFGGGDMLSSVYASNGVSGRVDNAATAEKLATARNISLAGDATGSASFDGSANASITAALAASGVSAGTYPKVTVDAKGRVTGGASLAATDIPSLTLDKITDAGTAAGKNTGTAAGNVPVLDANGKLASSAMPDIGITDTFVVANQAAMLALTAQKGDVAVRSDVSKTFILTADPATTLANWVELATPADGVQSVNGQVGPSVSIDTDDVSEGDSNKYYTDARFSAAFAAKSSSGLTDGAIILRSTDTLILNSGPAA